MTHHYGEDAVTAYINGDRFTIVIQNHVTGAEIRVDGPIDGVFETYTSKKMDQSDALRLGNEIAHLLRKVL